MKPHKTSQSELFLETDAFINNLNPKSCSPPFIINAFLSLRTKTYNRLFESKPDGKIQKNELKIFLEKFEIEHIETLRFKLKERYVDYVLQKQYNIPSEVSVRDLKKLGAYEELKQLATSIAEWSLELEILAYTIEGLKLYGLTNFEGEMKKDYVNILKNNHKYTNNTTLYSMSEYVIRKMMSFTLNKLSSLSLIRALTKMRFGTQTLVQIFMAFVLRNQMPWTLIVNSLNLPWLLGGFLCSMMLKKINNYIVVDEALGHLSQIYSTFEKNKLLLVSERRNLIDAAMNVLNNNDKDKDLEGVKQMSKIIENMLNSKEVDSKELETMFDVKDVDDFVVVEDKEHKETVDDSGVLVVDW